MPGIDPDPGLADALRGREFDPLSEERLDVIHHVVVGRVLLHRPGSPSMCMSTTWQSRSAQSPASSGSARSAVTSLTIAAPASSAASATATLEVSIEISVPAPASPLITGLTRSSPASPYRHGSGPGGLPTDVEHVGALGGELAAMRYRPVRIEEGAPVGERVGGHVDDPHDARVGHQVAPLGPDQLPVRRQLDEVVRFAPAVPLALVRRLVVHRLSWVVRDVGDPVGQAGQALRDARAGAQVLPGRLRLAEGDLCLVDGLLAIALANVRPAASAATDQRGTRKAAIKSAGPGPISSPAVSPADPCATLLGPIGTQTVQNPG